ncbi:MAG: Ribosome maturation factor RimM [Bacteroidia bacterium]|nr:MAG: ribosome maturation factor rimM [Bacteroidetes bacterium OLB10]MBV6453719.1 Ribosome maturation factor RimM [Bacteroidia bacterium]
MGFDGYFFYGTIGRTHGIRGHLILKCADNFRFKKNQPKEFFISDGENLKAFPVKEISFTPPFTRFLLEAIHNMTEAEAYLKKDVYLPLQILAQQPTPYKHELTDATVVDENKNRIGIIKNILEFPQQLIAQVYTDDGKEVLIPLNDHFILNFDKSSGTLTVQLPDGLLDVYLN